MRDSDYNISVFAFSQKNELWEHINYLIDINIEAETNLAIGTDLSGEQRIHACGRAESLKQFKNLLNEERKKALNNINLPFDN
jgi:hypothetical protein